MHEAEDQIRQLLRERHRLREGKADDFTIQNQADVIEAQSSTTRTFSLLVIGIAVISLIIGGAPGALAGICLGKALEAMSGLPVIIQITYVLVSMMFFASVGMIFGFTHRGGPPAWIP